jgi:pyruvate-ferredoxin/flavodoxin oxidoreductase
MSEPNTVIPTVIMDGNEAAASVAYRLSEVIAIYPITPSSPMAEWADQWLSEGKKNIWGALPIVEEMQSEGGAAGALHGALQAGAFGTTFTASQGLLLMIPTMFKIAGELIPATMHVTARTLATHCLSIFGDHSDVMACRSTGWAMLASNSVQEVADLALVAQIATLESRIPFINFFDGFRTSHEVGKILPISDGTIRALVEDKYLIAFRKNALTPDRPFIRGTAQNPDVFFQAREACTPFHAAVPGIVQSVMDRFARQTGRAYHLFDYYGVPDAERVIMLMGSGAEAAEEAVDAMARQGEKLGLLKVRLYRPFDGKAFLAALPATVKSIAVLDRCKEPGGPGEPLYQDVVTVLAENAGSLPFAAMPAVIGGRYGLSSKEFTPAMVKGVFDELTKPSPKNHFTIGINDDVSHTSLSYDPEFSTEDPKTVRALFYGLGSDGTVGANKNSIKIIGSETPNYAQGYFVYDSKKSGLMTTSHLRFGPNPIRSTYLITRASFVACHNFSFLEKMNVLEPAMPGAVFLLNSPYSAAEVWDKLPRTMQEEMLRKKIEFYVIDGYKVAREAGMGSRINTIMQTCFFAISGVLPREEAIAQIKKSIKKTYGKRGESVVQKNFAAVDHALAHLEKVELLSAATSDFDLTGAFSSNAPKFVHDVLGQIAEGKGDLLPVSAFPAGGAFPTGTAQWEKRNIAQFIPVWDENLCIQCGKCVMVCPHAVIRAKIYDGKLADKSPATLKWAKPKWRGMEQERYTLQVAPEDCTGCAVCVEVCPVKSKSDASKKAINMAPQAPLREPERENWEFFLGLPEVDRSKISHTQVKDLQLLQPLFEFSGACSGCGETPYIKLMTQLFGDRLYIANATGCSSIYGGNLPTTPYTHNAQGRGPTWNNSLFEDNAEFGFGMRTALDQQKAFAETLVTRLAAEIGAELAADLVGASQKTEPEIEKQRERVSALRAALDGDSISDAQNLLAVADALSAKAYGSSAATAGPSTSALAASTMFSDRART